MSYRAGDGNAATPTSSMNRTVAYVFGAVYLLVAILGFIVVGSGPFADTEGDSLLGFEVNHLHNIVHLLIGLALLGASKRHDTARSANLAIGATYLLLGVLGPVINGSAVDIIALNGADNVLHLLSGLLLVAVAVAADKKARTRV